MFQFLFKTNNIIDKLNLDKGFTQDTFTFDISQSAILNIAIIVIGGLILADQIPNLFKYAYQYIQQKELQRATSRQPDFSNIIFACIKICIGLLLLGERNRIVEFIEQRQKKKD